MEPTAFDWFIQHATQTIVEQWNRETGTEMPAEQVFKLGQTLREFFAK